MSAFLKITLFSLAVVVAYTLFSVYYIPQVEPGAPPKPVITDYSGVTPERLALIGREIYDGKGACLLCHDKKGGRAPALYGIMATAEARIKDKNYGGKAKSAEEYIMESMVSPSAYVVPGYGVLGSKDTVSPMPDVSSVAVGLSLDEMKAVVEYLKKSSERGEGR